MLQGRRGPLRPAAQQTPRDRHMRMAVRALRGPGAQPRRRQHLGQLPAAGRGGPWAWDQGGGEKRCGRSGPHHPLLRDRPVCGGLFAAPWPLPTRCRHLRLPPSDHQNVHRRFQMSARGKGPPPRCPLEAKGPPPPVENSGLGPPFLRDLRLPPFRPFVSY